MLLWPEVVDAFARMPMLATGGLGRGRPESSGRQVSYDILDELADTMSGLSE